MAPRRCALPPLSLPDPQRRSTSHPLLLPNPADGQRRRRRSCLLPPSPAAVSPLQRRRRHLAVHAPNLDGGAEARAPPPHHGTSSPGRQIRLISLPAVVPLESDLVLTLLVLWIEIVQYTDSLYARKALQLSQLQRRTIWQRIFSFVSNSRANNNNTSNGNNTAVMQPAANSGGSSRTGSPWHGCGRKSRLTRTSWIWNWPSCAGRTRCSSSGTGIS
ncbi:uncharacterized protein [Triticum aestivum]|uniref:uncharacterized protein n=1 Tax=Triticum aestivum TaxID=4565 RepID=UPI001D009079|nr:uncharacterized protein LOC123084320 [Triticum aestivum]